MNRLFDVFHDKFSGSMPVGSQHGPMKPSIDVNEPDQELRMSADLPGVSEDNISVSLVDDILTSRGEKKLDEKANYHIVERSYGTFLRSQRPPYSVDTDKIRADFAIGVLTVTLPKLGDEAGRGSWRGRPPPGLGRTASRSGCRCGAVILNQ